ncbi:MAG: hypothetical protein K0Q79_3178 [Flavipsychrobacter sp.]|jgi:type IX secretion system PorP/SprF family membrane protein|nr:hypothetical protein [Flavipsychrobacter sp.]
MKKILISLLLLLPLYSVAQSDQHYTMFMYNKLLYNPGYAGSRDVISCNAVYRDQWDKINGAPKTINISVDAPVGTYMKPFRKVAVGFSLNNEKLGVENNTNLRAYYAYRIQLKRSVVSFGLSAGGALYSAKYSDLSLHNPNDPNFNNNINNSFLPNVGAGVYWSGDRFYVTLAVPNMLQNYYDRKELVLTAKQIRGYYLGGGYVFKLNETIVLQPQVLMRYATNAKYKLPFNCDINVSAIAYDRILLGVTYRTDKSIEAILHVQATRKINIGYAYDYMMSGLQGYNGGTHEIVLGYDLVRDNAKFHTPRFIKKF